MHELRSQVLKRSLNILAIIGLLAGLTLFLYVYNPAQAQTVPPPVAAASDNIITDNRLRAGENFLEADIQQFLDKQPGPLKSYRENLYAGYDQGAARSLAVFSLTAGVNPKVLLALLEVKNRLLSTANLPQSAIDFALGFDKLDRKGFSKQLVAAAGLLSDRWAYYDVKTTLIFKDGSTAPASPLINRGTYAVQATLAYTADPATWQVQSGTGDGSFYQVYKTLFGDPLAADPLPAGVQEAAPAPFLLRPFNPADLIRPGDSEGKSYGASFAVPSSDGLDYNAPSDAGVNTYFDHEYPSDLAGTPGNPPDNAAPGVFLPYRGREVPSSFTLERGYSGHNGIDFKLAAGKPILAAASGKVVSADWGSCGKTVIVDHNNGYRTLYLHMDGSVAVNVNQDVNAGQLLGHVGNFGCTSPHLHFGVQFNFRHVDPFGFCPDKIKADPWEIKSGTRSFWLWKEYPSPCAQQYPHKTGPSAQEVAAGFTSLTLGQAGQNDAKTFEPPVATPTPALDVEAGQQDDVPAITPNAETILLIETSGPGSVAPDNTVTGKSTLETYLGQLNDRDSLVRQSAINGLGQLGAKEAIPPLLGLLSDPDRAVRNAASNALLVLGAKEQIVTAWLNLLADRNDEIRQGAAAGLREMGDLQTINNLNALLTNPDPAVRQVAGEVRTYLKIKLLALNVALGSHD